MPLETLREEIFKKTASLKFSHNKIVSRTFYVLMSSNMKHLESWFQEWFPIIDGDLRKIYPWIVFDSSSDSPADVSEIASQAWLGAFDVGTTGSLTAKGFRIMDTANQLIFVGDLTEENSAENLAAVFESFHESLQTLKSPTLPLYKIGLFLIRSIGEKNGRIEIRNAAGFDTFSKWAQEHLDRAFLIDISNQYGTVVSETRDLHFLLGQLLYILTRKPIEFDTRGKPGDFGEWVRSDNPAERRYSGFSGVSILTPVDQILETALAKKGAEVLQEAFFGEPPSDRTDLYLTSLLSKTGLNSYDTVVDLIRRSPEYPLIVPFTDRYNPTSVWNINHPESFITYTGELNKKLPDYAAENEKAMSEIGKKLLAEFRYSLIEHLNTAISGEKGGLRIAKEFLGNVRSHISDMIPKEFPDSQYAEPLSLIEELAERARKGPRKEAVAIRTVLLSGAALLGTVSSKGVFDIPSIAFPIAALAAVGGGLLQWYGWKNRTENLVIKIWETLQGKWESLMQQKVNEVLKELLPLYVSSIDEMISRVANTSRRLEELIDHFKNKYNPPAPSGSAFWIYSVEGAEELGKYSNMLDVDISQSASDYLSNERPLELWDRVAPPESPEFNPWELHILEKAALRLIPYSGRILELSVCRILRDFPEKADNFTELFIRSAYPFLTLKVGQRHGDVSAALEVPEEGCQDIHDKLIGAIKGHISNIQRSDPMTTYRISLFSFLEGVDLDSLNIGA